jgi:hypothetical protein
MHLNLVRLLSAIAGSGLLAAAPAMAAGPAPLPPVNLLVEVRWVEGGPASTEAAAEGSAAPTGAPDYTVGTHALQASGMAPQRLWVQNGASASMHFGRRLPMQWLRAASLQPGAASAAGAASGSGARSGGAVVYGLTWLEAGQGLSVHVRWPGGAAAVAVELEIDSASVGERSGSELPASEQVQTRSRLLVPVGRWVTVASLGAAARAPARNTWSSAPADAARPLPMQMQLRVSTP